MKKLATFVLSLSLGLLFSPVTVADETEVKVTPQSNTAVIQVEGMS